MAASDVNRAIYRQIFNSCDADNDGNINYLQLQRYIDTNPDCKSSFTPCILWYIWRQSRRAGNNILTYKEFLPIVSEPNTRLKLHYYCDVGIDSYCKFLLPPRRVRKCAPKAQEGTVIFDSLLVHDGVDFTVKQLPYFMIFISLLELVCFVLDIAFKGADERDGPISEALMLDPDKRQEVWRFFTYTFVHLGWMHLTFNVTLQILLGTVLEMHQRWRIIVIFMAGVIAGSLGVSACFPRTRLYGASGGVFAIVLAQIVDVFMNRKVMKWWAWIQVSFLGMLTVLDCAIFIYSQDDIAPIITHIFGGVGGLLVGIYILRILEVDDVTRRQKLLKWLALVLYIVLMISAILVHVLAPNYFPQKIKQLQQHNKANSTA